MQAALLLLTAVKSMRTVGSAKGKVEN